MKNASAEDRWEGHEVAATAPVSTASPLLIRLFGPFEVWVNGAPLPRLRSRKGQWLLALLALRHGRELERAWIAALLWPDSSASQAFANLRLCLTDLRHALGPEARRLLSPSSHRLTLDLEGAEIDVGAFDEAIARGDETALEAAIALYRGPLLEGCEEEWVFQERQPREQAYLAALERLAARALQEGDPATAEKYLRRAIAVDPLRESAHRGLMQVLAAGGNYAAAMLTYRELRVRLHREVNTEPDAETQALFQQLRAEAQGKATGRPDKDRVGGVRGSGPTPARAHSDHPPVAPSPFPQGTLTFLFTDIEGSTRLWERHPEAMRVALARHDALLRQAIEYHGGSVFKTVGDRFCAAFPTAADALAAALAAQRALQVEAWGEVGPLRVRMALHTGAAQGRDGDYFGPPLNRISRLLEAAHGGQTLLSLATQELVRETLPHEVRLRDLGVHRLKDLQQPEHLFQLLHPSLRADFPPLRSLEAFAHNLPAQWTSFVGREREMAEVKRLLSTHRLVTLTGAGGCGKTRLGLQVAAEVLEEFIDGAWLVELAPLADPDLVPRAVASVLGVREEPDRLSTPTLVEHLASKKLLVVLDNCEHLLHACAYLVEEILRGCPQVRVLSTSREGLGMAGEQVYRVPSLSVPDARQLVPVERLQEFEAVRLFVERALLGQSSFTVTPANAAAVIKTCQRLDGIPLAIELAAARVRTLPVEKIAERLDDRFRLLTGGSRTALPRQQTLRALIDWSYDLLSERERMLLRRLSVFSGGWMLEAAQAICSGVPVSGTRAVGGCSGVEDPILEEWEVFDLLASLVDKSLVQHEALDGEARYRLLETVRQYARERLFESGEGGALRERHLDYYLRLAEAAETHLSGLEQAVWLERLEREHDNLRAALEWSLQRAQRSDRISEEVPDRGDSDPLFSRSHPSSFSLRLVWALTKFWDMHNHYREGREWLRQALARGEGAPVLLRARAFLGAGNLARSQGDLAAARRLLEQSLALFRESGELAGTGITLQNLGRVLHYQGEHTAARSLLEEALPMLREAGNEAELAWALEVLGHVAYALGDLSSSRAIEEESLALFRALGNELGVAVTLRCLGEVAYRQQEYASAGQFFAESRSKAVKLGDRKLAAHSLGDLAWVAYRQGDLDRARSELEEAMCQFRELDAEEDAICCVRGLGWLACQEGNHRLAHSLYKESLESYLRMGLEQRAVETFRWFTGLALAQGQAARAARLLGAEDALREMTGMDRWPPVRPHYQHTLAAIQAAVGDEAFATAWREGRAMTLEQAAAYATNEPDANTPTQ